MVRPSLASLSILPLLFSTAAALGLQHKALQLSRKGFLPQEPEGLRSLDKASVETPAVSLDTGLIQRNEKGHPTEHSASEHSKAEDAEEEEEKEEKEEDGEDEGEKHEEDEEPLTRHSAEFHEKPTKTADSGASMLLAMTVFQVSLFYMVNYPNKSVRAFTWSMLSSTISIFVAILIWHIIHLTSPVYSNQPSAEHKSSTAHLLLFDRRTRNENVSGISSVQVMQFLLIYAIFNVILAKLSHFHNFLTAYAMLGGHCLGFAASEVLSGLGATSPWNTSWTMTLCYAVIACGVLGIMNFVTGHARKLLLDDEEEYERARTNWEKVCEHTDHEFAAFAIGLLVTLSIQFMITGELPTYHGNPYGKTMTQTRYMFYSAVFLAALMAGFVGLSEANLDFFRGHHAMMVIHVIEECLSFSFGWCFLFACRCLYWTSTDDKGWFEGDQMTARIVQALVLSFFTFIIILSLTSASERGYIGAQSKRCLMNGFGLMLGLSWEGAFSQAIEDLTEDRGFLSDSLWMQDGPDILICIVVIPAWALYIMPQAQAALKEEAGKSCHNLELHDHDDH